MGFKRQSEIFYTKGCMVSMLVGLERFAKGRWPALRIGILSKVIRLFCLALPQHWVIWRCLDLLLALR